MTVLVALPGLDGTTRLLSSFAETARAAGFDRVECVAYPADRAMGYAQLEVFARERLPRSAPFVLLGESFSGPVAISIAASPPPNLVGLALSTTFARAPVPLLAPFAPLTRFAPVRGLPTTALSFALLGRWRTAALERELRAALDTVSPATLRSRAAAAMRIDVSALLARIPVPTLVLRARHDRLLRAGAPRQLLRGIPGARGIALDGPHLLLQTRTDACVDALAAFAAGPRRRSAVG